MAKIVLNEQAFDFDSYTRNTYFNGESITSSAYIGNMRGADLANTLAELGTEAITSISITVNDEPIYTLSNINAHINSMDESFNGVDQINTNLNLQFN